VNAPIATTAAAATTPATVRQYRHARVSGRLGTAGSLPAAMASAAKPGAAGRRATTHP
jgi:hypothetical protein